MMSSASVMNPRPTRDVLQVAQMKQSLCQWRSSKEMNLVPPIPTTVIVLYTEIEKNNQESYELLHCLGHI
jgi:hypothetical protein